MATGIVSWSQTAASNATADSNINWAEGQAPSSVNDSARALMASAAKYRDDSSGALLTGGTSTAYTLTSNQGFASKAAMNGAEISFTVSATNGASPTLNVDGLGGDPISLDGTNAVPTGTMVAGSVYSAVYYNSGNSWRLKDFYQLPFVVPIGGIIDWMCPSVPNSNFIFPNGQAISRTTYATLFGLVGTTYGTGDGSTTFNVPDLTGRVVAMKEASATRLTSSYFGGNSTTLGATGGLESHTMTTGEMPVHNHGITDPGHVHAQEASPGGAASGHILVTNNSTSGVLQSADNTASATTGITINNAGSGNPHNIVQPTLILNKILRIL